jgi:hypothetical protein
MTKKNSWSESRYAGLDVSRASIVACVISPAGRFGSIRIAVFPLGDVYEGSSGTFAVSHRATITPLGSSRCARLARFE